MIESLDIRPRVISDSVGGAWGLFPFLLGHHAGSLGKGCWAGKGEIGSHLFDCQLSSVLEPTKLPGFGPFLALSLASWLSVEAGAGGCGWRPVKVASGKGDSLTLPWVGQNTPRSSKGWTCHLKQT